MTGEQLNVKQKAENHKISGLYRTNTESLSCSCSKDLSCMKNHSLNVLSDTALVTTGPGRQN